MSSTSPPAPHFEEAQQEIAYWKSQAELFQQEAKKVMEEFEEFQEGSRELEKELETQLEQGDKSLREYKYLTNKLQLENDSLKDKLEQCHKEYHNQISELQTELSEISSIRDHLNKYIRELEQKNDDLERAKRETLATLEDLEGRMNAAIERNAFLESELDEKESLKIALQRMKDEKRDLRAELHILAGKQRAFSRETSFDSTVLERCAADAGDAVAATGSATPDNDRSLLLSKRLAGDNSELKEANNNRLLKSRSSPDSNKLAEDVESRELWMHDTPPSSASTSPSVSKYVEAGPSPLTSSARMSALNIVGDLLRKVGALELKLSSCRSIVKDNAHSGGRQYARSVPGSSTPSQADMEPGQKKAAGVMNGVAPSSSLSSSPCSSSSSAAAPGSVSYRPRRFSRGDSVPPKISEY